MEMELRREKGMEKGKRKGKKIQMMRKRCWYVLEQEYGMPEPSLAALPFAAELAVLAHEQEQQEIAWYVFLCCFPHQVLCACVWGTSPPSYPNIGSLSPHNAKTGTQGPSRTSHGFIVLRACGWKQVHSLYFSEYFLWACCSSSLNN